MKHLNYTAVLGLSFALAGCQSGGNTQEPTPVKVKVMEVSASETDGVARFSGTVEEANGTELSFSVSGTVQSVHVKLGDRVVKGQLVATVDPVSLQSNYNAAQAALNQAEDAYQRMKQLHDKNSLPDMKWVEVQSQLKQAQSAEEVAHKSLKDSKLYAPYSGVISDKQMEVGQNVMPGMTVAKLVTAGALKVKIAVPESEIANIELGRKATITVSALGGSTFEGTVVEKGIVANPLSRSYDVKLQVENSDSRLMPGMVTEVVLASTGKQTVYVVPVHIVQLDEKNHSFVWVNANGKATKRIIECGDFTSGGVTVVSGLNEGDAIIIEGQQKVCEGTLISE